MECKKVRKEYPNVKIEPCCPLCHEENIMGVGKDLWYRIDGRLRNVCCAVMRSFYNEYQKTN